MKLKMALKKNRNGDLSIPGSHLKKNRDDVEIR